MPSWAGHSTSTGRIQAVVAAGRPRDPALFDPCGLEQVGNLDAVQAADSGEPHAVDPPLARLALGDIGRVRAEPSGHVELGQARRLAGPVEGLEEALVLAGVL